MIITITFLIYLFGLFTTPFFASLFHQKKTYYDKKDYFHNGRIVFDSEDLIWISLFWPPMWAIFIVGFVYTALGDLGTAVRKWAINNEKYKPESEHEG